jgi:micrococcal nuclease
MMAIRSRALAAVAAAVAVSALSGCSGATPEVAAPSGPAAASDLQPRGDVVTGLHVLRVVDGDTLHVLLAGQDVTVRMIGMNTPETVKQNSPVECFGPEASDYAKRTLTDQTVTLEFDDSQGRTDKYGRTLAYVWLEQPDGARRLVNLDEVALGFARERQYGPTPYAWRSTFQAAADTARAAGAGLWGACA